MALVNLFKRKQQATPSKPRARSTFMLGELSPFFYGWRPALREWQTDVAAAYVPAVARAVDAIQNSGWLAGGIEQAIASTIGTGLRLNAKPDYETLGWTLDQAQEWARKVEWRWDNYASCPDECDVEGKASLGKLTAQALRTYFAYGEIAAGLPYVRRPGTQNGTKVQMITPSRIVQRTEQGIIQGVRVDRTGYPLGYIIARPPQAFDEWQEREVPARDPYGRRQFIHVFDGFPGQARGIPPITPVLKVIKQYDQLADATLMQALIQAIFAASIKSQMPTEQTLQAFQDFSEQLETTPTSPLATFLTSRAGWYDGTNIDLGRHGKIAHLAPGDELTFHTSLAPNETYEAFVRMLLREISRCLGITFEQFSGDYTGATYSSVRMGSAENWLCIMYRRVNICGPFLQAIYEPWLEEEIELGRIDFPGGINGYLDNRAAAGGAHWRGPAKPVADDLKQAKAISLLKASGVITDEWICNEFGLDWEEVYDQLQREQEMRKELDIEQKPVTSDQQKQQDQQDLQDAQDERGDGQ